MKRIKTILAACALLITSGQLNAQNISFVKYNGNDYTQSANEAEKKGAAMTQPGETFTDWNYGTIDNASTGVRFFKFTNTGQAPLIISSAKGSCGCTVPSYPKEPIMPGEENYIKVKYDTKRTGAFTKYVTLTTNNSENTTVRLRILGTVNPPAAATPANTPAK